MSEYPCYVFWHIYIIDTHFSKAKEVITRQWNLIHSSGLYKHCKKIHIGYISCIDFPFNDILDDNKVEIIINDEYGNEGLTATALHEFCKKNEKKSSIVYFHNRGSNHINIPASDAWTKMMEYFIINRWEIANDALTTYYTSGCEMYDLGGSSNKMLNKFHYSGNFWWARSSYIKKLPKPSFINKFEECENWILSLAGNKYRKEKFLN